MKEKMLTFQNLAEYEKIIQEDQVNVFLFTADWCGDCIFLKSFFPSLMEMYPTYNFYYVDRDEWIDLAKDLGIMGIPSFVVMRKGVEVDRFVSKDRKTKDEVNNFLSKLAKREV